ncbi:MAG: hypothetical protein K0R18_411 [Bacillales bacterium]|jgi:radical SAM superfamily enzyme|nr:hypothetical protein [Bacillales bacterium]
MAMFSVDVKDWIEYGKTGAVNQKVVNYIQQNPDKLFDPEQNLYPRGWQYVSHVINNFPIETLKNEVENVKDYFRDAIGNEAEPFIEFLFKEEGA